MAEDITREDLIYHYPEFARSLHSRTEEILPQQAEARKNMSEQVNDTQGGAPGDEGDLSVIDTSTDYFLSLANQKQLELVEIRDAYSRMNRGVYGVCEKCEETIALDRLRKLPTARLCISCQSMAERRVRHRGGAAA
jgi:DnaK suppressor protein